MTWDVIWGVGLANEVLVRVTMDAPAKTSLPCQPAVLPARTLGPTFQLLALYHTSTLRQPWRLRLARLTQSGQLICKR